MSIVQISVADSRWQQNDLVACVRRAAGAALEGRSGRRVSVHLTDDDEMRTLNRTWRQVDRPTNVLAFPAAGPPVGDSAAELGDVALGFETVDSEARARNLPVTHHLAHLVVHGILHLRGFDHGTDAEAMAMETRERVLLAGLGIGNPHDVTDR